jgi:hypothetical protein
MYPVFFLEHHTVGVVRYQTLFRLVWENTQREQPKDFDDLDNLNESESESGSESECGSESDSESEIREECED